MGSVDAAAGLDPDRHRREPARKGAKAAPGRLVGRGLAEGLEEFLGGEDLGALLGRLARGGGDRGAAVERALDGESRVIVGPDLPEEVVGRQGPARLLREVLEAVLRVVARRGRGVRTREERRPRAVDLRARGGRRGGPFRRKKTRRARV